MPGSRAAVSERVRLLLRAGLIAAAALAALAAVRGLVVSAGTYPLECASVVGLSAALACAGYYAVGPVSRLRESSFMLLLVTLAGSLRLAWIAGVPNRQVSDFAIYHELGAALATGQGYATTGPIGVEDLFFYVGSKEPLPYTTAYRPPGAPLWAAVLYRLFGVNALWFKLSNAALSAGTCFLIYFILLQAGGGIGTARATALLWAVYPESVFATNLVCTEVLFTFLLLLLAAWLSLERNSKIPAAALLQGVVAAGCSLVRPMWLLIVGAAAAAWWLACGWKEAGRRSGLFTVGLALGLAPWIYRNFRAMHALIPVATVERIDLVRNSYREVPDDGKRSQEWTGKLERYKSTSGEVARYEVAYAMVFENLKEVLLAGPAYVVRRVAANVAASFADDAEMLRASVRNWNVLQPPANPATALSVSWIDRWGVLDRAFYLAIVLAAAAGAFRLDALRSPGFCFLEMYFLANFAALLVFEGVPRLHFPLMVVLFAAASRLASPSR
jgi:hypothetical protein